MENSSIQKFLIAILPKKLAADMEAESRSWMLRCSNCKYEQSVWEIGGVRWKAAGNPRIFRSCLNCGKTTWQMVYRKA